MIAYACSVNAPLLARWDGSSWASVTIPAKTIGNNTPQIIKGSSASNIWMAGDSPAEVWYYNGTSWSLVSTGITSTWKVNDLLVLSPTDVWLSVNEAGASKGIYFYDGATWSLEYNSSFVGFKGCGTGTSKSDAFLMYGTHPAHGSYRYNGSWSQIAVGSANWVDGISCLSSTNVWARTAAATPDVYSFNGTSWSLQFSGTNLAASSLNVNGNKIYSNSSNGKIWIMGDVGGSTSTTLHYWYFNGTTWSDNNDGAVKTAGATLRDGGIHGDGDNVCMVGGSDAFFWNGTAFTLDTTGVTFNGVKDVFVVPSTISPVVVRSCPLPPIGSDFTINNLNCLPSQFYDGSGNSLTIAPYFLNTPMASLRNRANPLSSTLQEQKVKFTTLPKSTSTGSF